MGRTNIKYKNGLVMPPAQVFYVNGHTLQKYTANNTDKQKQ
jgi:hypothetical protein